ncbi:MAG: acyltransferase family protein [Eubacteriaceae bacterium]|nr:acyltransferase family protein [Eubacteriaceae bacterium]
MNPVKKRDYYFDNAKFLLILFVVFGHLIEAVKRSDPYLFTIYISLYSFHVAVFVFISGHFAGKSKSINKNILNYIKIYVLAQTAVFLIMKILVNPNFTLTISDPYWTLWFILAMAFWFMLVPAIKKSKKAIFYSILAALLVGYDSGFDIMFSSSRVIVFLPFFIGGMLFEKETILNIKKSPYRFLLYGAAAAIVGYIFMNLKTVEYIWLFGRTAYGDMGHQEWYAFIYRLLAYLVSFVLGATFLTLVPDKKTTFAQLGSQTLPVYLSHGVLIKVIAHYGFYVLFKDTLSPYWLIVVAATYTIAVSLIFKTISHYRTQKPGTT